MTPTPQEQLDQMNAEIKALQKQRYAWIAENLHHFAKFTVGDRIYADHQADTLGMQFAGIVKRVYLKQELTDERVKVYYEFDPAPHYHYSPNTEGGWTTYYNQKQYESDVQWKIEALQIKLAK
jgi:hypothetical protein